ncbi:MAG: mannose-1-phosphate guanylyltransferase [Deltaproteobacteria bacterium]|nr:mannose-1-phosphate guanylyltransferase [Deltaproteobacteria bacterium]
MPKASKPLRTRNRSGSRASFGPRTRSSTRVQVAEPGVDAAVLIIAGGRGTRFWPESRVNRPKPLFSIDGKTSLLADTVRRMEPLIARERVFILAAAEQAPLFRPVLKNLIPRRNVIVEPEGRGTAVAIAYGTGVIAQRLGDQAVIAVMPADHYVAPATAFQRTLGEAILLAAGYASIVVIGVKPSRPEIGYGYLKVGAAVSLAHTCGSETLARSIAGKGQGKRSERAGDSPRRPGSFKLDRFVEKPAPAAASKMVNSGKYLWNAGMFVMRAATLAAELEQHAPLLGEAMRALPTMSPAKLDRQYRTLEFDAFDRVVAEKSTNVLGVHADFTWHDVGSWDGLWEALRGHGRNVLSGNVLEIGADGVLARARDRLMVLLGVKDLVAIETPDVILIANRTQSQDVRRIIDELKRRGADRYL